MRRLFRRGRHRAHKHSVTVFDLKMALINEQLAAQKPWTLADLEELRGTDWRPQSYTPIADPGQFVAVS